MSDEREKVVHTYDDDIHELDNRLPVWWQYTLYGAIVFAIAYWFGEHQIRAWSSQRDRYDKDMIAARLEAAKKGAGMSSDALVAMSRSEQTVRDGKQVFQSTCAPCHRADGGGNIGPNLTDAYWLHGSKPENIFSTVHDGVPAKGMPTWGPQLGEEKVAVVVAYVLTLRDTNVPGGKPPQGDPTTP
ncbi:MAG TPA: c-type cytochrome [Polyangiaceae bacterium]|jgi:cytochrome c oxidase cbb3-type subunit 3